MTSRERPPLDGLRVIDLTTFLSGPSATQLLGDLGADIIKVESLDGDSSRAIVGPVLSGESAYFLANNRNKRSIAVNLKSARGVELLQRLIAGADVVVENFRPGVIKRLGIDPETAVSEHPALVWASISGFGQEGPLRDRPAYDMVVQALSGVMSLNGHPGAPAARLGIPAGDVVAGLYAVIGILAALQARRETGRGRIIDVSMLRGQLAMLSYQAVYAYLSGAAPGPQGAAHDSIATYRSFTCGDGRELVVTANTPRMWEGLCRVLGVSELTGDARFADAAGRLRNKQELWAILESRFAQRPAAEWAELLAAASVPVALVKNVLEALGDARAADDGSIVVVGNGDACFENVATPIRFLDTAGIEPRFPPALGGDTVDILAGELGLPQQEVESLIADGVVAAPAPAAARQLLPTGHDIRAVTHRPLRTGKRAPSDDRTAHHPIPPPRPPVTAAARVAVVSGGAAGIGRAIAGRLARDGFQVAILDIADGAAEQAAKSIENEGGVARGYQADVSDREQVDAALAAARADLGPLAVVVANAAVALLQPFLSMTLDQWNRTLAINLTGTFNLVQSALPDLVDAGWGRVVLISSSSAQRGAPRMAHYAASKGGQMALTKALAVEFAKSGVTVNTVAPSAVDTPSVQRKREAGTMPSADVMAKNIPVGRMGTGDDIAGAVSYLVSDDASYVTGQTVSVNGGAFIG